MDTEQVLVYLFIVQSVHGKTLCRVPEPSILFHVQGPALHVLYCQICHSWLISYRSPREKGDNAVSIHDALGTCLHWNNLDLLAPAVACYRLLSAGRTITRGALSAIVSLMNPGSQWLSPMLFVCFIADDHKCKSYPMCRSWEGILAS